MNSAFQATEIETVQVGREMTLGEHLLVIRHYLWVIAGLAMSGAAITAGWSSMKTPIYEATASVVIDRESPSLLDREREPVLDVTPDYLQTHFELLKSQEVIRKTAELLNLSQQPEYRVKSRLAIMIDDLKQRISDFIGFRPSLAEKTPASPDEEQRPELEQFRRHILVSPVRGSRVVHIMVQSQEPKFAAKAANTLASVYIDHVMELKASTKEKASKWFSTHLEELRRKVEESEFNLYAYRSKYGLMDAHERQMVAAQQLAELNSELVKAEMKRADVQVRHQQIVSLLRRHPDQTDDWSSLDNATEILQSPLIQVLRTEEIKASARVAELADKYGPLHPKMAHAKSELEDLRQRIQNEMQKIYNSVKHDFDAALARAKMIREAVEKHKQEKVKLEQHEVEHAILDREAQSNRQLYDTFLRQMKETNLTSGMLMSSIYLADPAVTPETPVGPRTRLNIILGLLAGLLGGIGLAFVLDYRDHSFKGPDDVERYLPRLPLLGIVPVQLNGQKKLLGVVPLQANGHHKPIPTWRSDANGVSASLEHYPNAEYYRTIRTNILLSSVDRRLLSLVITSPGENEGKTTVAVNLAIAMAQLETLQVVLINGDLRKPSPRKFLGVHQEDAKGLTQYLMGEAAFEDVIYPSDVPRLWVVPHGMTPPNPSELLHSRRMTDLLKRCGENGFQVIMDAPPVLSVADSIILAAQAEGVVLVVSEGETSREACRVAINRIASCGGKLIGVILQKARPHHVPSYVR